MQEHFRLFAPSDLVAMFPKDTVTASDIESKIKELGTYHRWNDHVLLTGGDIREFVDSLAAKHGRDRPGLIVFIGSGKRPASPVFVGWCPLGQEFDLLDRVRVGAQEHVMILAIDHATYGEVEDWKSKHRGFRTFGSWFERNDEVMDMAIKANTRQAPQPNAERKSVRAKGKSVRGSRNATRKAGRMPPPKARAVAALMPA